MTFAAPSPRPWRVAITRDEPEDGPLTLAIRRQQLMPVACPLMVSGPPDDRQALAEAAAGLDRCAWVVCASVRAVEALRAHRTAPWPDGVRSAAVGQSTARALVEAGAPPPVTAPVAGAEALWAALAPMGSWPNTPVLILTTPGGRPTLIEGLRAEGADVRVVDAYQMVPRSPSAIREDWLAATPDAVVLTSPRAVTLLADAIGPAAIASLLAVAAIGDTTAERLAGHGIQSVMASGASFDEAAVALARCYDAAAASRAKGRVSS